MGAVPKKAMMNIAKCLNLAQFTTLILLIKSAFGEHNDLPDDITDFKWYKNSPDNETIGETFREHFSNYVNEGNAMTSTESESNTENGDEADTPPENAPNTDNAEGSTEQSNGNSPPQETDQNGSTDDPPEADNNETAPPTANEEEVQPSE